MRTLWLASTALLMSAAFASAQSTPTTASTTAPAPTGAIASPQVTPQGDSPGKMAPTSSPMGMQSQASSAAPANGAASPAPNGAASAPNVTASAPKAAPGKMAPNSNMAAGTAPSESAMNAPTHPWHHNWSQSGKWSSGSLPSDASPAAYLHIAKRAIAHHNAALADDALSHAETRLLDRSVPQGGIAADDSPAIQSIESARQALHAGNYMQASMDIKQAASAASGM